MCFIAHRTSSKDVPAVLSVIHILSFYSDSIFRPVLLILFPPALCSVSARVHFPQKSTAHRDRLGLNTCTENIEGLHTLLYILYVLMHGMKYNVEETAT